MVRKSAPMVALYLRGARWDTMASNAAATDARPCSDRGRRVLGQVPARVLSGGAGAAAHWLLNFLLTYWFMSEVLPTPESPRMITFSSTFLRLAIALPLCLRTAGARH